MDSRKIQKILDDAKSTANIHLNAVQIEITQFEAIKVNITPIEKFDSIIAEKFLGNTLKDNEREEALKKFDQYLKTEYNVKDHIKEPTQKEQPPQDGTENGFRMK